LKTHLIQYLEEEKKPAKGTSALSLPTHQIKLDYSQFNHKALRAVFCGTMDNGKEGFLELLRGRRSRPALSINLEPGLTEPNEDLKVGDRGDLYIICEGPRVSRFKFMPDRREARQLG
jgi:hypothetical protein